MRNSLSGGPRWWVALAVAGVLGVAVAGPSVAHPVDAAAAPVAAAPAEPDPAEPDPAEPDPAEPDPAEPGEGDPDPADGGSADVPEPAWVACRDGFQCARVDVPMDYDDPDAGTVSLQVIRKPAADGAQRRGSLFINPGGPGAPGTDVVRFAAAILPLEVRRQYDIVGFDPRGVGLSAPVRCFATLDELFLSFPPFAFPVTPEEENLMLESDATIQKACAERGGPLLEHMSTGNVARDMDVLRRAVGDEELNYLGFSYGSVLGTTYANLFPDKVGAVVLDGVLDPVAYTGGDGGEASPLFLRTLSDVGTSRALGEFFRLCDEAGSDCDFSGGAQERYEALATTLRENPPEGEDAAFLFSYADLVDFTAALMYAPVAWPDFATALADIEASVAADEPSGAAAARMHRVLAAFEPTDEPQEEAQEEYPNFILEGTLAVACVDSDHPPATRLSTVADAAEEKVRHFGRRAAWVYSTCSGWPAQDDDRYAGPWTAHTSSPVLVVGNTFDPVTTIEGAEAVAKLLPESRLLTYDGWGHTAYLSGNYCVDRAVTSYLVSDELPEEGAVCSPEGSPFGPLAAVEAATEPGMQGAMLTSATAALDR